MDRLKHIESKNFSVDLQKNFLNMFVIKNKLLLSDGRGKSMHYPESPKVTSWRFGGWMVFWCVYTCSLKIFPTVPVLSVWRLSVCAALAPKTVVYFDQLLGAACTQKLVELPFSAVLIFSVHLTPFLVVSQLKSTKNVWKWTKKLIFVYSSKLVDKQKQVDSLRGYLEFVIFWLIFYNWNQSKRVTIWSSNIQITGALYDGHFQFEFY